MAEDEVERLDLLAHKVVHPVELTLKVRIRFEVPGHRSPHKALMPDTKWQSSSAEGPQAARRFADGRELAETRSDRHGEHVMASISEAMRTMLTEQRLGFLATTCADGSPNLSPKGLTFVLDDEHLVIGEIRSPVSVANLRDRPIAEVNVVDPIVRKGFRFKGACVVHDEGPEFERLYRFLREQGAQSRIRSIIVLRVDRAAPIVSPVYDSGVTEADVSRQWIDRTNRAHPTSVRSTLKP